MQSGWFGLALCSWKSCTETGCVKIYTWSVVKNPAPPWNIPPQTTFLNPYMKMWNWRKVLWVPCSWSLLLGRGGWWRAAALGAERRSSEVSASLACWQHICPGTPGLGSVLLLPLPKRKRKTHSSHPFQPFGILHSRARKRWTAAKYPCWFWNDVESWGIKSHHVSPNFINSGLSFFGWIFLSFKPQSSVLRNTGLGSVKEHCAKLNRWFWQDQLGSESSFPACRALPWQAELQRRANLVPRGIGCSALASQLLLLCREGMHWCQIYPQPRNLGQFIGNLSMVASKKPPSDSSGEVTGGTCWIVLFCFTKGLETDTLS